MIILIEVTIKEQNCDFCVFYRIYSPQKMSSLRNKSRDQYSISFKEITLLYFAFIPRFLARMFKE